MKPIVDDAGTQQQTSLQEGVKLTDFVNPRSYSGMWRFWFFDIGSVSFLLTAVFGLALGFLSIFTGKTEPVGLMFSMAIVAVVISITWQMNRLIATETSHIIPGYRRNILVQAGSILLLSVIAVFLFAFIFAPQAAYTILLSLIMVLGFMIFSLRWQYGLQLSMLAFINIPIIDAIAAHIPWLLTLCALVLVLILLKQQLQQLTWNDNARSLYLNGLEMGWMWLPDVKQNALLVWLNRQLHPVNFFIGPFLASLLVFILLLGCLMAVISSWLNLNAPVMLFVGQFLVMGACLIHWSRIQRWRSAETLLLLPCFNGLSGLQQAFNLAAFRLVAISGLTMLLTCLLSWPFTQAYTFAFVVHVVLAVCWGAALALAVGAIAKNVLQIAVSMLVFISHSIYLALSFKYFEQAKAVTPWLVADGILLLAALLLLLKSKHQVWRNGVIDQ